jgi:hypothetical protein
MLRTAAIKGKGSKITGNYFRLIHEETCSTIGVMIESKSMQHYARGHGIRENTRVIFARVSVSWNGVYTQIRYLQDKHISRLIWQRRKPLIEDKTKRMQ